MRQTTKNLQQTLNHVNATNSRLEQQIAEFRNENKLLRDKIQAQLRENSANKALRDSSMRMLRSMCQVLGEMTEQIEHIR